MSLASALETLAETITTEAGIPATTDPRNVNPPGAWVGLDQLTDPILYGGWATATAVVMLVAPDVGHPRALTILSDLLDTLGVAVPVSTVAADTATLSASPTPLPALRCTVQIEVEPA